jgi:hypothetical protein
MHGGLRGSRGCLGSSRSGAQPETGVDGGKDFFIWIRRNPLKRPDSAKEMAIITLTKPAEECHKSAGQAGANMGADITISIPALGAIVRQELVEFFHDGCGPTLGQYSVDRIVGAVVRRLADSYYHGLGDI